MDESSVEGPAFSNAVCKLCFNGAIVCSIACESFGTRCRIAAENSSTCISSFKHVFSFFLTLRIRYAHPSIASSPIASPQTRRRPAACPSPTPLRPPWAGTGGRHARGIASGQTVSVIMTSVKVCVRVRPMNTREIALNCKPIIAMQGQQTVITGPGVRFPPLQAVPGVSLTARLVQKQREKKKKQIPIPDPARATNRARATSLPLTIRTGR